MPTHIFFDDEGVPMKKKSSPKKKVAKKAPKKKVSFKKISVKKTPKKVSIKKVSSGPKKARKPRAKKISASKSDIDKYIDSLLISNPAYKNRDCYGRHSPKNKRFTKEEVVKIAKDAGIVGARLYSKDKLCSMLGIGKDFRNL